MKDFTEFNDRLRDTKEKLIKYNKSKNRLALVKNEIVENKKSEEELGYFLKQRSKKIKKLEKCSLLKVIYTIFGILENKLNKATINYLSLKLKYDNLIDLIEDQLKEKKYLKNICSDLNTIEKKYDALLKEKEKILISENAEVKKELMELYSKINESEIKIKEINEAIETGKLMSQSIMNLVKILSSAKNWGIFDILGGGIIATAAKHSKLNNAKSELLKVQKLAGNFEKELIDINKTYQIQTDITIGGFLKFADYFFDGFLSNILIHSKISDGHSKSVDLLNKTNDIINQLKTLLDSKIKVLEGLDKSKQSIIEDS